MSKKKAKPKRYSKKELAQARLKGDRSIFYELARNLLRGTKMSIAETEAAASLVKSSRPEGSISKVSLASIPEAQNHIFITLYLAYYGDLEGQYGIIKFSGDDGLIERVVSREEKREDVIRLNEYYHAWNKKFATNRHSDQILNLVINEITNLDLKEINSSLANGKISIEEYDYRRKGTILLSKYLYLKVSGICEELQSNEVAVNFNGKIIEITQLSMVHILNRHYAAAAKQYDSGRSFHQDPSLKFFEDPEQLKAILEQIGSHAAIKKNDIKFIPFKLNGVIYSVHTENKIKGNRIPFIQLQTFYPTDEKTELQRIQNEYIEIVIGPNLSGYKKN